MNRYWWVSVIVTSWLIWPAHLAAESASLDYRIEVSRAGEVVLNGTIIPNVLELSDSRETIIVPIIPAFDQARADLAVIFVQPFAELGDVTPRLILSRCACRAELAAATPTEIRYRIRGLTQGAGVSLAADFPRGSFDLPLSARLTREFDHASPWLLGLALLLLVASSGLLGFMVWEYANLRKFSFRARPVDRPPNELTPTLLSLLPSGKMSDRTLVAMLLDLARRGFITMRLRDHTFELTLEKSLDLSGPGFAFGSIPHDAVPQAERDKAAAEGLTLGEKYLLAKLFVEGQSVVTQAELHARFRRHLSSWKIGKVFAETYQLATRAGLFIRNPHLIHLRYRALGVSLFFLGITAFVASVFFFEDQLAILAAWSILALVGYLITRMVRYLPLLTVTGHAEWIRWEAFEKYLTDRTPLPSQAGPQLFAYLPYAVAFGQERVWVDRFADTEVALPSWLTVTPSDQPTADIIHDLKEHLFVIGRLLAKIHEHTVR